MYFYIYTCTMPEITPKKVAYLFGAGATHAEMVTVEEGLDQDENLSANLGLLTRHVSQRVFKKAQTDDTYHDEHIKDIVTTPEGAQNIELFISLLEGNSQIVPNAAAQAYMLRELVEEDITSILNAPVTGEVSGSRTEKFLLHKALLELHQQSKVQETEILSGIISLNYDTVLDQAYETIFGVKPSYGFSFDPSGQTQLLKLHGSFDWDDVEILGKKRKVPIIPLGANKNYLRLPYNYIWGHALELLATCDILRVVGCSMSSNDTQLIDLLFKAHIERRSAFDIEIINTQNTSERIKGNYGFLPKIITFDQIEGGLVVDPTNREPFKEWLKDKGLRMLPPESIEETEWLKQLIL